MHNNKGVIQVLPLLIIVGVMLVLVSSGLEKKDFSKLVTKQSSPTPSENQSNDTIVYSPSPSLEPSISPKPSINPTQKPSPVVSATPTPVVNNVPPGSGYSRQSVTSDVGTFTVSLVASEIASTRVIVDTASSGDCTDNCPVLSLGDYVSRNGAFAGINGSYFCPSTYPDCQNKKNSFDTLLMNKDKVYFNSANNVYSNVPAVIFGGGYVRFIGASSEWGRETGINSMIANQPLLLSGGNITFGGDGDPKKGSVGNRSFVSTKGGTVYIGVVQSATVAQVAHVLKAMGMENALNLDSGGSTALWSGGYKFGPGRNIPNAILFTR